MTGRSTGRGAADDPAAPVREAIREHWGYVLAILVGSVRDWDLAEDSLQDAAVAALERWPQDGPPDNPRGWLFRTAQRKAIDRLRRARRFAAKEEAIRHELERTAAGAESGFSASDDDEEQTMDQRLSLIFTCCHPALTQPAQVALTLRTLGGLSTGEIARAFLVPEPTMAQRIVRAKKKIHTAGIPYRVPPTEQWAERLDAVLAVLYLVYNEGYRATSGEQLTRTDLSEEAIRLARILAGLAPQATEAAGLLALMLLHDARRSARTDDEGELVPLELQDRGKWDRQRIAEGDRLLREALSRGQPGPYQIQAAISAVHAFAASHAATDWDQIAALYRRLHGWQPSPVIRLNEAVAVSYAGSAEAALEMLAGIESDGSLDGYQPFHAARADLLRRAGRVPEAQAAYDRAIELTDNERERRFLRQRKADLPQ